MFQRSGRWPSLDRRSRRARPEAAEHCRPAADRVRWACRSSRPAAPWNPPKWCRALEAVVAAVGDHKRVITASTAASAPSSLGMGRPRMWCGPS